MKQVRTMKGDSRCKFNNVKFSYTSIDESEVYDGRQLRKRKKNYDLLLFKKIVKIYNYPLIYVSLNKRVVFFVQIKERGLLFFFFRRKEAGYYYTPSNK